MRMRRHFPCDHAACSCGRFDIRLGVLCLLTLLGASAPVSAEVDSSFEASAEYALRLGDEIVADAEVYFSPRRVAYLVISERLDQPLMVSLPEESVTAVETEAVAFEPGRARALVASSSGRDFGGFERRQKEIRFRIDDRAAALVPASPILGWQTQRSIRSKNLVLSSGFAGIEKSQTSSDIVLPDQEVQIDVYFGSWDGFSQRVMPKIMRLEEELAGSSVRFRYYGLPRRLAEDRLGAERSIHGVPTVVVSTEGGELGRLVGRALDEPGQSLQRLLSTELGL